MGGAQEDGGGRVMEAKQSFCGISQTCGPKAGAGPLGTQSTAPQTGLETQGAPRGWP